MAVAQVDPLWNQVSNCKTEWHGRLRGWFGSARGSARVLMQLSDAAGSAFELTVTGYQFPDAALCEKKYSWHMLEGAASWDGASWTFRYPALTCDETPRLSAWLRSAADWLEATGARGDDVAHLPEFRSFPEPNLAFRVAAHEVDYPVVEIDLSQEFRRPRDPSTPPGFVDTLSIRTDADELRRAASEWDAERAPYPNGLA